MKMILKKNYNYSVNILGIIPKLYNSCHKSFEANGKLIFEKSLVFPQELHKNIFFWGLTVANKPHLLQT